MKILSSFIVALFLIVLGTTINAQAQSYGLGNTSGVTVTGVYLTTSTCGTLGPYTIPANSTSLVPIGGCTVTGMIYMGILYVAFYNGPVTTPPPGRVVVTIARTVFMP